MTGREVDPIPVLEKRMSRLLEEAKRELADINRRLRNAGLPHATYERWHAEVYTPLVRGGWAGRGEYELARAAVRANKDQLAPVFVALRSAKREDLAADIERRLAAAVAPLKVAVDDYQLALARQRAMQRLGGGA